MKIKAITVAGTRPNFVKIAPLIKELERHKEVEQVFVHTGQHYDKQLSKLFFRDLKIPKPDINLEVGSGSHALQTGEVMVRFEKILHQIKPDLVVVVGDVNSTLACALTAKKLGIRVAHVEAGLRSFDMSMPEEINRVMTDRIADFLFTTEETANKNLMREGIDKSKIFFVGNVMIDSLLGHREKAKSSRIMKRLGIEKRNYAVLTLHRPSNVDNEDMFSKILDIIDEIQKNIRVIYPMHPRSNGSMAKYRLLEKAKAMKNLTLTEPLGYLDFLCLMDNSKLILTDSGGIQEEATVLNVPCITLRNNTERPVTVEQGTNLLISTDKKQVIEKALEAINGKIERNKKIPELWDGKAAQRIVEVLIGHFKR